MAAEACGAPRPGEGNVVELRLLDGPYVLVDGCHREPPEGCKRLLVLLAVRGSRVERREIAGLLWPVGDDVRAAGNLRSALWRMRSAGFDLLETDKFTLRLKADTVVDVDVVLSRAARVLDGRPRPDDLEPSMWPAQAAHLLPGWHDEWVVFARERLRQRLLYGLENVSRLLVIAGRCADAVVAAAAAVHVDALRESAQRVLIEAHLAGDDWAAARLAYQRYRREMSRELAVAPSAGLAALLHTPVKRPTP